MNLSQPLAVADVLIWALVFFVLFSIVYAAREGIRHILQLVTCSVLGVIAVHAFITADHRPDLDKLSLLGVGLGPLVVRPRSRRIPARVKRKVIANYEQRTGKKYNSRQVEIDHLWPFSRGGSHTVDNLRVINRTENRRKGARKPSLRDWF